MKNSSARVWKSTRKQSPFVGRLLAALLDGLAAGNIDGDRLGQIDMLTRGHGRLSLLGMEIGRRLDHDRIQVLFQQSFGSQLTR